VRAALDQVGLLGRERSSPLELSVGEQQRVGIARAVISKPQLLIADEPTGNLDPALAIEVMLVFKRFQEVGVTVIIASHDPHLVETFGEREIVLDSGRIAADNPARRRGGAHDGAGAAPRRPARHPYMSGAISSYGTRHLQALFGALGRLARAPLATLLTLIVIGVALSLPAGLALMVNNLRSATGDLSNAVDFTVHFKLGTPIERVQQIARGARERPGVESVTVTTADAALEEFKQASGFGDALTALGRQSPLPHHFVRAPGQHRQRPDRDRIDAPLLRRHFPRSTSWQLDLDWVRRLHSLLDVAEADALGGRWAVLGLGVPRSSAIRSGTEILNRAPRDRSDQAGRRLERLRYAVPSSTRGLVSYGLGGAVLAALIVVGALAVPRPGRRRSSRRSTAGASG
jgi:energy-coupling factor transporter ATP-binding protein EcfA2